MGEILLIGFLMDLLKGGVAIAAIWGILRLADKAMGLDFNNKIQNLDSIGFGIYSGSRWIAMAYLIGAAFL